MFGDVLSNDLGWTIARMDKVAPVKSFHGKSDSEDGKYWLLNLDMIEAQTGRVISKNMVLQTKIGNSTMAFSVENVLYSKLRPYLNKVVIPDKNGYATTELLPLKPDKSVLNPVFFVELLRGNAFLEYIQKKVAGTKMPRIQMDVFNSFSVILPPLPLQNRFADFVRQTDKSKFTAENWLNLLVLLYAGVLDTI